MPLSAPVVPVCRHQILKRYYYCGLGLHFRAVLLNKSIAC